MILVWCAFAAARDGHDVNHATLDEMLGEIPGPFVRMYGPTLELIAASVQADGPCASLADFAVRVPESRKNLSILADTGFFCGSVAPAAERQSTTVERGKYASFLSFYAGLSSRLALAVKSLGSSLKVEQSEFETDAEFKDRKAQETAEWEAKRTAARAPVKAEVDARWWVFAEPATMSDYDADKGCFPNARMDVLLTTEADEMQYFKAVAGPTVEFVNSMRGAAAIGFPVDSNVGKAEVRWDGHKLRLVADTRPVCVDLARAKELRTLSDQGALEARIAIHREERSGAWSGEGDVVLTEGGETLVLPAR